MQVTQSREGALLEVRVVPRSRPALREDADGLVIGVAAPAVEGRATEEARRALAAAVKIPAGRVTLARGARSRRKTFLVQGLTDADLRARLRRAITR